MGATVDDTVAFMQGTDMAATLLADVSAEVAARRGGPSGRVGALRRGRWRRARRRRMDGDVPKPGDGGSS